METPWMRRNAEDMHGLGNGCHNNKRDDRTGANGKSGTIKYGGEGKNGKAPAVEEEFVRRGTRKWRQQRR